MTLPDRPRITVVNDNAEFLRLMQDILQDATYPTVVIDGDRANAVDLIEASEPELLIIDLRLSSDQVHGLEVVRKVRERAALRDVPTILCTADRWALNELEPEIRALQRVEVLPKPFSIDDLHAAIDRVLGR